MPVVLSLSATPAQSSSSRVLPEAIRTQLTAAYPGWRFATLDPRHYRELSAELRSRRSPEWVSADFNGDRRADYAVFIVWPGARDAAQMVVVFVAEARAYNPIVLQTMPEQTGVYLRVARQGDRVRDYEQDANGRMSFILRHDAIDIVSAGTAATTCVYEFGPWRCFVSAD
jgi:hypothetical protein